MPSRGISRYGARSGTQRAARRALSRTDRRPKWRSSPYARRTTKRVQRTAPAVSYARLHDCRGTVCAVLSGGNIDPLVLTHVITHGLRAAGRYLAVKVTIPDLPGGLSMLLAVVSESGASVLDVVHSRTAPKLALDEVEVMLTVRPGVRHTGRRYWPPWAARIRRLRRGPLMHGGLTAAIYSSTERGGGRPGRTRPPAGRKGGKSTAIRSAPTDVQPPGARRSRMLRRPWHRQAAHREIPTRRFPISHRRPRRRQRTRPRHPDPVELRQHVRDRRTTVGPSATQASRVCSSHAPGSATMAVWVVRSGYRELVHAVCYSPCASPRPAASPTWRA